MWKKLLDGLLRGAPAEGNRCHVIAV